MMESFYGMYKAAREMVENLRHKDLDPINREFVDTQELICKQYDRRNIDMYERWKKEWNEEKDISSE